MSDPTTPESTTPEPTTPEPVVAAAPVAATAATTPAPVVEAPVAEAPVAATPVAEAPVAAAPVAAAPVVVVQKRKGRAVGVWSFILGLLAILGDLALIVFIVVTLFSVISSFQTGNYEDVLSALQVAGVGFLLFAVFVGGFVVAALGALLGLIALFSGRGRVVGVFGFLLSAAALGTRIALITGGLNIMAFNGG